MLDRLLRDIIKYRHYSRYAAKAELKSEVANSYLNWIWWILEPFLFMLVYVFVSKYILQSKTEHFPLFVFLGISIWTFFYNNILGSVVLIKNNKHIITKIYVPKFILIITKIYKNFFKMGISLAISFILVLLYHIPLSVNMLWIIPLLLEFVIIVFGLMTLFLHFGVYIRDMENLVRILLRIGFFITGIFYSIDNRIGDIYPVLAKSLNTFNPIAFILNSLRGVVLYDNGVDIRWFFIWLIISLLFSYLGINLIYKNENNYVKVI